MTRRGIALAAAALAAALAGFALWQWATWPDVVCTSGVGGGVSVSRRTTAGLGSR